MSWEIKYTKGEKFIYSHSKNWPFRNFRQIKELNKLKNKMKEDDISEFDKIEIGNDSLLPEMLNINLIIHMGEINKLTKLYNRILEKNKKALFSYPKSTDINILNKTPLYEYEQTIEFDSIIFLDDEYYQSLDCSIYRLTESFLQVSFRFHISKQVSNKFNEILINYSSQEYKINNFKLTNLNSKKKQNIFIHNNRSLTRNEIFIFLDIIKKHSFSLLNNNILDLHIGSEESIFSIYAFSYLDSNKNKRNNRNSIFGQMNLDLKANSWNSFSTGENLISFLYEVGENHILDSNSEILFFNRGFLSENDLMSYGGDFSNYISSYMRISVEITIAQDFLIISLLVYYYGLLTKYRFRKTKKYSKFAYFRYNNFLNNTLFLKSFVNEYNRDYKINSSKYLMNLGDLKNNHQLKFSEVIYKKIENQLQSIQALNSNISDIISLKKENAIIKSNRNLQIIVIIITLVNIGSYSFEDIKIFILTLIR